ncbi:thiamine pyrophosphate-binding protein [Ruegeria sp. HKCCA5491]|uniref:thiamine pyrophosphate-binding protein n=1 Tax=Ruegeria sp. HKCCA5491 TaxID=2682986 RepID=UPI00148996A8|nr:thiamine pyrophosphate-binding protein [Ruegeria sp. HKCCA5491]
MKRPLGAQISHMLKERGVDVIFGIPGVHNQEMYRGIEEAGITHVLARHEQGAGFMADGYARATGKPGVAYVITGPGLCNIMTPMGQGYSDSVPMLVISSCLDETQAASGQLHQMKDQRAAAEAVADWSCQANTAQAAYGLVERAFEEFALARPRPKHIQVPIAQLEAEADAAPFPNQFGLRTSVKPPDVAPVLSMLNIARRPLFILGGGTRSNLWRQILTQLGAACFTTFAGRGMAGLNYSLDFGAHLSRPGSAEVIASADLVVAVGAELGEVDLWRNELGNTASLVRVDLDPKVLSDHHRAAVKLQMDGESFAHALWASIDHVKPATGWAKEEVAEARARWKAEVDAVRPGVVPVIDALRDALPADTMIYSDMTQFAYVAKEVWDMAYPYLWHHPTGFGTLGYALPAGIGGAVARRGKPTAVIAGDYGFHYTMMELGVAVELGLSLPIILWDNGKLKEIEDSMVRGQIAPNAVVAHNPDFCRLAEAFGALSAEPSSLDEMQKTVRAALDAPVPTLIRVTPDIV